MSTSAENSASVISAGGSENHYTWIEEFEGSSNTQGQVMLLDSSMGYGFGRHVWVGGGVPCVFRSRHHDFERGNLDDELVYCTGRFLWAVSAVVSDAEFQDPADGTRTHGQHVCRNFRPDIYRRAFASYGELAHFQIGTAYHVVDWLGVAASAFDVAPWGTQTIDSRGQSKRVTGGSSLAADNGFSAGVDLAPARAIDFTVGYSRSTHYHLNTISFDVAVNMREMIVRRPSL